MQRIDNHSHPVHVHLRSIQVVRLVSKKAKHLPKHKAITGSNAIIQGFLARVRDLLQSLNINKAHDLSDSPWNCDACQKGCKCT